MRRLLRLIAIIAGSAILMTGTAVAFADVGDHAFHGVATAQVLPLPPINSQIQEGSTVYADDGKTVLGVLRGPELRQPIALSQVSHTLIQAVLDTEDHGFYVHGGFDIPATVRALVNDANGGGLQGGSTIPQQLVKQLYLGSSRTINRKIREAVLADRLERAYTKDEILQAYLNTVYFGSGSYGIQAAAETYFNEPASALNLPQSALLAGLIQSPSGYDPILDPVAARTRRSEVLNRMYVYHDITPAQEAAANLTALPTHVKTPSTQLDPVSNYYLLQVRDQLLADGSPLGSTAADRYQALFEGGLKIITNLDPQKQSQAEAAVAADTPANSGGFIEGLVSVDPATGAVRALVGGTGTQNSQFDVMTQGARQPGSGFKLFTLLTALEQGYSVYDTVDSAGPCYIKFPGNTSLVQSPIKNDAGPGGGVISLVSATAGSVNCAYIRLAHEVGLPNIVDTAQALGISPVELPHKLYDYIPSMVIGTAAVKPIEMAAAYASVADNGVYHQPSFIDQIQDRGGTVIYNGLHPGVRVFSPQIAAEADVAFRAVVTGGTGTAASLYNRPVAGKTGTTEKNVDAWFNGFTPQLETTVWMGNLKSDSVSIYIPGFGYVYGANFPAHTWHDYSENALAGDPVLYFPPVEYGYLPATKFITSPSLVADDVKDHNGGYSPNPYNPQNPFSTTTTSPPVTAPPPPSTTPTTQPKKKHPPPTTLPASGGGGNTG